MVSGMHRSVLGGGGGGGGGSDVLIGTVRNSGSVSVSPDVEGVFMVIPPPNQ